MCQAQYEAGLMLSDQVLSLAQRWCSYTRTLVRGNTAIPSLVIPWAPAEGHEEEKFLMSRGQKPGPGLHLQGPRMLQQPRPTTAQLQAAHHPCPVLFPSPSQTQACFPCS